MYYDDFYNENDELDRLVIELKESALKGVKQDILDKVSRLEKENKELQEIKNNWDELKNDYQRKERELLSEVEQAKRDAKKLPIKELFENLQEEYYVVERKYDYIEKCDKCDDNRKLTLIDSYGRETKVDCVCKKMKKTNWLVETKYLNGINSFSKRNGELKKWVYLDYYKSDYSGEDGYYTSSKYLNENVVNSFEEALEALKKSNKKIYFTRESDAQRYADYLNKNLEEK